MVRDPRDVCASRKARAGVGAFSPFVDAYIYRRYVRFIEKHLERQEDGGKGGIDLVRFEDLVQDSVEVGASLFSWLGMRFKQEYLFNRYSNNAYENGNGGSIVHSRSVEKWRDVLSAHEVALVEGVLEKELREYGYQRVSSPNLAGHVGVADLVVGTRYFSLLMRKNQGP